MLQLPSFPPFSYEKVSHASFIEKYPGNTLNLGVSSDENYDIYGFELGDPDKPTIIIFGAIHGNEWQSAYWSFEYYKYLSNPSDAPLNKNYLFQLSSAFHFVFVPVINPYGFDNGTRSNKNGVDLERNFPVFWEQWNSSDPNRYKGTSPFSEAESQIIKSLVEDYKPFMILNCHSWGGQFESATYLPPMPNEYDVLYENAVADAQYINGSKNHLYRSSFPNSQNWVNTLMSKNGTRTLAPLPEIGNQETVENQGKFGVNMLFIYCLYAYNYFKNRTMSVHSVE